MHLIFLLCSLLLPSLVLANELEVHSIHKPAKCDRQAQAKDLLTLHYTGTLKDGKPFDSSRTHGEPFKFQLGVGHVIPGWEKGLLGVCAGEKLKLTIPPHLAYGDQDQEGIPAGSTLEFDIEVLKVEDGPKPVNVFAQIDTDGDKRLSREEVGAYLMAQLEEAKLHGDVGDMEDPDQMKMVEEIFQHEDKDKDAYITFEEFSGPKHDEL